MKKYTKLMLLSKIQVWLCVILILDNIIWSHYRYIIMRIISPVTLQIDIVIHQNQMLVYFCLFYQITFYSCSKINLTNQFLLIVFQNSIDSPHKYYCEESDKKSVFSKLSLEKKFHINVDENRVCINNFHLSHLVLDLELLLVYIMYKLTILQGWAIYIYLL